MKSNSAKPSMMDPPGELNTISISHLGLSRDQRARVAMQTWAETSFTSVTKRYRRLWESPARTLSVMRLFSSYCRAMLRELSLAPSASCLSFSASADCLRAMASAALASASALRASARKSAFSSEDGSRPDFLTSLMIVPRNCALAIPYSDKWGPQDTQKTPRLG